MREQEREAETQVKHPGTRQRVCEDIVMVVSVVAVFGGRNRSGLGCSGWWCLCIFCE